MLENKPKTLFEFIRERFVPINAVVGLALSIMAVLDFMAPQAPYLKWLGILLGGIVLVLMLVELIFPENFEHWIKSTSKGLPAILFRMRMGYSISLRSPAWQSLGALAIVVFVLGQASAAKAREGGVLASEFPSLASLQKTILGVREDLKDIKEQLKNIKQETSADPRKELTNLGIRWTDDALVLAVRNSDVRVIKLFVESRFVPNEESAGYVALHALKKYDQDVLGELARMKLKSKFFFKDGYAGCWLLLLSHEEIQQGIKSEEGQKLLKNVCGGDSEIEFLEDLIKKDEKKLEHQRVVSENLQSDVRQSNYMDGKIKECMADENTRMLNSIDGARKKYCIDRASEMLVIERSPPAKSEWIRLANGKRFLSILKN